MVLRQYAAGMNYSNTKVLLRWRGSRINEPIIRFNRERAGDQVRKAVTVTREKEGANLRKKMIRCTENGDVNRRVQNRFGLPAGLQKTFALDLQATSI
jgi:hypothetical protein